MDDTAEMRENVWFRDGRKRLVSSLNFDETLILLRLIFASAWRGNS